MTDSTKSICLPNNGNRRMKNRTRLVARLVGFILLIILSPILFIEALMVLIISGKPIFFRQERVGINGKKFWMYKFRTMYVGAERDRNTYINLNEADGPVFKIRKDPRFTKIGKFLSHSGLDELAQLINVAKGEMAIIGPRPLPVYEEREIGKKYKELRRSVLPGIISTWVLKGSHGTASFDNWMRMDVDYISNKSAMYDFGLFLKSIRLAIGLIIESMVS